MGKASRWFKGLLGLKRDNNKDSNNSSQKDKKRWSFGGRPPPKSDTAGGIPAALSASDAAWIRSYLAGSGAEQNKHAIAVAAATAAAADAAVAAAQAAVAVVRLTTQGGAGKRDRWAAAKIQAVFRGYLARKALRALKGLVKIQALVRGFLVRKRAAATLHSMQALIRAQTAVRTQRARRSSFSRDNRILPESYHPRKSTAECDFHSKRLSGSYYDSSGYDDSPKIVEIDTCRPRSRSRRYSTSALMSSECGEERHQSVPLPGRISVPECQQDYFEWYPGGHECRSSTAHSTPRLGAAALWANAPATPAKSVCGDAFYFPNYMASTQSFSAKLRSHSAPKQRPESGPKKRLSLNEILAARNSISGVRMHKSYAQFQDQTSFINS